MMIRQFASGLVLSVLTISIACAPRIDNLAVAPGSQDQDLTASADIKPFMSGVGTPSTSVDDLSTPDAIFSPAGTMARTTGNHYEGTIPGLPYGAYQLRVKVPYTLVLLPLGTSTRTAHARFFVDAPAGAFTWDSPAEGVQGWTFNGIFDGTTNTNVSQCPGSNLPAQLTRNQATWPLTFDEGESRGSLAAPLLPGCLPNQPSQVPQSGFWRFDLISPGLQNRPEYQQMTDLEFRVRSPIPVRVQPVFVATQDPSSPINLFVETNNANQPIFHELAGGWNVIRVPDPMPAGRTLDRIRIRVFGNPLDTNLGDSGNLLLDGVVPLQQ